MIRTNTLWKSLALVAMIGCSSFSPASGRTVDASNLLKPRQAVGLSASISVRYYYVDSSALAAIVTGHEHMQLTNFPGGAGGAITLDLKPAHSPIDATTQFVEGTSAGDKIIAVPQFVAYRGKVLGEPNSHVFLTSFSGKLLCSITRESGDVFVLGPAKTQSESGLHILTRESDLLATTEFAPFNCLADGLAQPNALIPTGEVQRPTGNRDPKVTSTPSTLLQTDIAIEADSCFFFAAGNTMPSVLGYIASLFAMSSSIFEDEANITWHLSWIKVWTSGDPYHVAGNAYGLEPLVPNYWKAHYADVPRDLAHVMTSIGYGGGGFGWFSLCDTNWSYSVSSPQTGHQYPTFAFTYDAYIVAHEIGHNFSLRHSHNCWWDPPLDTCFTNDDTSKLGLILGDACNGLPITPRKNPGTIMSYCQNANYAISGDFGQYRVDMTFSARGGDSLRKFAELTPCIQPPVDTTLILLSPRGSESYRGDSLVPIQWTFAHLDSVALEYSPNSGSSWVTIASSLPAADGKYMWKVPNVNSQKMAVRVVDAQQRTLADTSLLFFAVTSNAGVMEATRPADISISPDPAQESLTISSHDRSEIPYEILNARGVVVRSGRVAVGASGSVSISLENLPAGTYFMRTASGDAQVFPFIHVK